MRRWENSVAATIYATVLAAMLFGFSLQQLSHPVLSFIGLERQQTTNKGTARFWAQIPGSIATMRDIIDATPDKGRPAVIAAAQRPQISIQILDARSPEADPRNGPNEPDANLLRNHITTLMRVPHPVFVVDRYLSAPSRSGLDKDRIQNGVVIDTPLTDGHWLHFTIRLDPPAPFDPVAAKFNRASVLTWLILSIFSGALFSILAAHRLVKPLSNLAIAVEQIGGSGDASKMALRGPREVQTAITAFNRMQERLHRFNDDRTRMIAAMSHDLRTPLTRLRLRSELVENLDQQEKMQADIDFMSELIESILSFARDDAKSEPRAIVDLSALVEGICENAADAGQPVTFSGPRGVTISCRPSALKRAISNLVENAVKYGNKAIVTLTCTGARAVITVEDEGPGIPRSERERVFDPFYRVENSRNQDTGGVGLGLSVTRSIILEHGGEITLLDRKGGGLLVRLELPTANQVILPHSKTMSDSAW